MISRISRYIRYANRCKLVLYCAPFHLGTRIGSEGKRYGQADIRTRCMETAGWLGEWADHLAHNSRPVRTFLWMALSCAKVMSWHEASFPFLITLCAEPKACGNWVRCLCMPLYGGPSASIQPGPGRSRPVESSGGSRGGMIRGSLHTLWSTSGKQQTAQNRIGPGESNCLIKTYRSIGMVDTWCWPYVISAQCSECQSEEIEWSAGKWRE